MQSRALLVSTLIDYAASWHGEREIVSRDPDGIIHRTNYAAVSARAKRLATVLQTLGVEFGHPVATLAWNGFRDMAYFGRIDIIMGTWSDIKCPSSIQLSFCSANLRKTSPRYWRNCTYTPLT
jgi:acyl-CoA synthetase (AMP-forming)/AMP-acid ligase II